LIGQLGLIKREPYWADPWSQHRHDIKLQ